MSSTQLDPAPSPTSHEHSPNEPCCASCAAKASDPLLGIERYAFAIGKIAVRFPNLGLEREFQRAAQQLGTGERPRGERVASVLQENRHIALRVCPVLLVGG